MNALRPDDLSDAEWIALLEQEIQLRNDPEEGCAGLIPGWKVLSYSPEIQRTEPDGSIRAVVSTEYAAGFRWEAYRRGNDCDDADASGYASLIVFAVRAAEAAILNLDGLTPVQPSAWAAKKAREPESATHPCDHADPHSCECRGACSCHWSEAT